MAQIVKNLPAMQETQVPSLGQEEPLEKGMATHSSILAWRIPWTEEPGGLQSTAKSCLTLATTWTMTLQASICMEFSSQEYWNGLPFPSPGDLPYPGIEPGSPALQADSLPSAVVNS